MRIHEVCRCTGLTKKAINWYESQGLIRLHSDANGYRDFSEADVARLKEISLLRQLGLSARDIKTLLDSSDKRAQLQEINARRQQELEKAQLHAELLQRLADHYTPEEIDAVSQSLESGPIGRRLLLAFPGLFGELMLGHFTPYLQEPVQTPEQAAAYDEVVAWLDEAQVKPPLLYRVLDRLYKGKLSQFTASPQQGVNQMLEAGEEEVERFKKTVLEQAKKRQKWYMRLHPLVRTGKTLRKRLTDAGYYESFLPALRRLSPSYEAYVQKVEAFNRRVCESQGIRYDEQYNVIIEQP